MNFGCAIEALKNGMKVARKGWNGEGMYVFLVSGKEMQNVIHFNHEDVEEKPCADILALKATTTIQVGWLASQTDMLAEDWEIVDNKKDIDKDNEVMGKIAEAFLRKSYL